LPTHYIKKGSKKGFRPFALFLSPFPHSPYPCTAIARQPTIFALNPLPLFAAAFRLGRTKTTEVFFSTSVVFLAILMLKTCGFLRYLWCFYFIAVSSLAVRLYGYRSAADDFRTKSLAPFCCGI
jgi:hypothetical protein